MEMSGQLHAPGSLPLRKELPVSSKYNAENISHILLRLHMFVCWTVSRRVVKLTSFEVQTKYEMRIKMIVNNVRKR
jgi:hypothetical protein